MILKKGKHGMFGLNEYHDVFMFGLYDVFMFGLYDMFMLGFYDVFCVWPL